MISVNSGGTLTLWNGTTGNNNIYSWNIDAGGTLGAYMDANAGTYTIGLIESGGAGTCASVIAGYTYYVTFQWSNGLVANEYLTSVVTQINSPTYDSVSTTTSVVFDYDWYHPTADTFYASTSIRLIDLTTGTEEILPYQDLTNGAGNYYTVKTGLTQGHFYVWAPFFQSANIPYGIAYQPNSTFSVIEAASSTYANGGITPNVTIGTSTLPNIANFLSFLNVPNLLQTKVPFGYFFQAKDAIQRGVSSSTASVIPSGTFQIAGIGNGTTTVDLFSTTTIGYFLDDDMAGLLRLIMLYVLYIEVLYLFYHRAKSQHII